MSITNDFRSAAGLRSWPAAEDLAAADCLAARACLRSTGQTAERRPDQRPQVAGRRRTAARAGLGTDRVRPGGCSRCSARAFSVSVLQAQFKYIFAERHEGVPSVDRGGCSMPG